MSRRRLLDDLVAAVRRFRRLQADYRIGTGLISEAIVAGREVDDLLAMLDQLDGEAA